MGLEHNHFQDERLDKVEIKCNSQDAVINGMCQDMAVIRTDLTWVKKIQWAVLTFAAGTAFMELINLVSYIISRK